MKPSILLFFIILPIYLSAQAVPPEKVVYEGEEYWRYEDQDSTYVALMPKWYFHHDSTGKFLEKSMKFPRDGKWICFYKQGGGEKVESIFHIKDSLLHGPMVCYDFQQRKIGEYNFHKRQHQGYQRMYNEQGLLTYEHQYQYDSSPYSSYGKQVGPQRSWYNNGQLAWIGHYNKNGKRHGPHTSYYENGNIAEETFYFEGQRDSTYSLFFPNGQLIFQLIFDQGKFVNESPYTEYHSNGKISGRGDIKGGFEECRKNGLWVYYHENGQRKAEGVYDTHIFQHNHGDISFAIKKGKWTYWYPNGALLAQGTYDGWKEIENKYFRNDILPFATAQRAPNWQYYDLQGRPVTKEYLNERGIFVEDK